jgi:hypothetical protein
MGLVATLEVDWSGLWKIDDKAAFLELVNMVIDRNHLEAA